MADDDLSPRGFPTLSWEPEHARASLDRAYAEVMGDGCTIHEWYMANKVPKARWSKRLRLLSAVLLTVGGLIPAVNVAGATDVPAAVGYFPLALAAGAVAIDRAFGFSTAWIRYMHTDALVQQKLDDAKVQWAVLDSQLGGADPTPKQVAERLAYLQRLNRQLQDLVVAETEQWVAEFRSTQAALGSATGTK